jgi:transcriptional regulator with XRE-family HTH domain
MDLKTYLESKNISAYEFCQATGIDKATLSRFLSGKRGLSGPALLKIVEQTSGMVSLRDLVIPKNGTSTSVTVSPSD